MGDSWASLWQQAERARGCDDVTTEFTAYRGVVLPTFTAPGLSFEDPVTPRPLWEVFHEFDWPAAESKRVAAYRVIGWDVLNSPLCIVEGSAGVWLLAPTSGFRDRQFVNTSVPQLAECLLAYVREPEPGRFRSAVEAIDTPALAVGSFWWQEAPSAGTVSERLIRECVTCMSLVVPPAAWGEYVARVRRMAAVGVNLWDATEESAAQYKQAEPGAAPDPAG